MCAAVCIRTLVFSPDNNDTIFQSLMRDYRSRQLQEDRPGSTKDNYQCFLIRIYISPLNIIISAEKELRDPSINIEHRFENLSGHKANCRTHEGEVSTIQSMSTKGRRHRANGLRPEAARGQSDTCTVTVNVNV